MTRMVPFADVCLGLEVASPLNAKRAPSVGREDLVRGDRCHMIVARDVGRLVRGLLPTKLVRIFDKQDINAIECMVHVDENIQMVHHEYVQGAMWRHRGTYSDTIGELLRYEKL